MRAILLKGHCLCNGKVIGLGCRDAVLNFVQSNFMENVNGTSFYYEWWYKYIDYCKGNSVDAGNTEQWRWKIFEQCQRYWILSTAFTEESCLLRARQPSSMLDLAKGNEWTLLGPLQDRIIYGDPHACYDNDSSELMIFYAFLLYMTWNHNDAIRCLALEPSPWHTIIIIYLVIVNDGCLRSKSLISG
ncbi:uncharacterized protein LOC112328617 isoform X1 [Populus trichocarpa]|uniref:uncharacterized protein LOC112328617 isoform X1 n=1 Tax=Populus trichocarpa TaxID=3694 RepID=UPI0022795DC2|nr:uncharacterized protein LOC112328617 isoform X1 [Populus trichocarpa]